MLIRGSAGVFLGVFSKIENFENFEIMANGAIIPSL